MVTSRRTKQKRNADFAKPKLKVGKKLTTNASHTDTSFKSRAIVVRTQSIQRAANVDALNAAAAAASDTLTTSGAPVVEVTTRHQTVRDLLSQFNHPSAAVRRDAVLGIIELSERFRGSPCSSSARSSTLSNTSFLRRNVHAVMASIVRLLVDEERAVRKVVLQFMRECFVRDISETTASPYFPTIMAYTASAMTHLLEHVRVDALHFLRAWMEAFPRLCVAHDNQARVTHNLLNLLGCPSVGGIATAGGGVTMAGDGASSLSLSMAARRMEVLDTLVRFVDLSYGATEHVSKIGSSDTATSGDKSQPWTKNYCGILEAARHSLVPPSTMTLVSLDNEDDSTITMTATMTMRALLDALQPTLISMWIECSPDIFDLSETSSARTSTRTPAMDTAIHILHIMSVLWQRALAGDCDNAGMVDGAWLDGHMKAIERHLFVQFPFSTGAMEASALSTAFRAMNMYAAQVMGAVLMWRARTCGAQAAMASSPWNVDLIEYAVSMLDSDQAAISALNEDELDALLKLVDRLLSCGDCMSADGVTSHAQLVDGLFQFQRRCRATSKARRCIFTYIRRMVEQSNGCSTAVLPSRLPLKAVDEWLGALPRHLWELKSSDPQTSADILNVLLAVTRRASDSSSDAYVLTTVRRTLAPYFHMTVKGRAMQGPFAGVDVDVQRLAVALVLELRGANESAGTMDSACTDAAAAQHALEEAMHSALVASGNPELKAYAQEGRVLLRSIA